jgi:hypothetical protein
MMPQRAKAIFEALRLLASFDGDRAKELNGQGFNKVDGTLGHRLIVKPCPFLSYKNWPASTGGNCRNISVINCN